MYTSCMATKTIFIETDVYDHLRSLKQAPAESFSQVLRRTLPRPQFWTAADLLQAVQSGSWHASGLTAGELQRIEEATTSVSEPTDLWLQVTAEWYSTLVS